MPRIEPTIDGVSFDSKDKDPKPKPIPKLNIESVGLTADIDELCNLLEKQPSIPISRGKESDTAAVVAAIRGVYNKYYGLTQGVSPESKTQVLQLVERMKSGLLVQELIAECKRNGITNNNEIRTRVVQLIIDRITKYQPASNKSTIPQTETQEAGLIINFGGYNRDILMKSLQKEILETTLGVASIIENGKTVSTGIIRGTVDMTTGKLQSIGQEVSLGQSNIELEFRSDTCEITQIFLPPSTELSEDARNSLLVGTVLYNIERIKVYNSSKNDNRQPFEPKVTYT